MNKQEFYIASGNGKDQLHGILWEPDKEVKAVLQISHGMVEYIGRYDRFARFLNEAGIVVVGNDHVGHGKTSKEEDWGYFGGKEGSEFVVEDLHRVTVKMKEKYKGLPYFVLGHSMGSFMIRRYIMTYGNEVDGVIIMGTGCQPAPVLIGGKVILDVLKAIKGDRHRSKFVDYINFGSFNKKIKNRRTDKDWLTKDTEIVDAYLNDPMCSFLFTLNGFETLRSVTAYIQKKENIEKIPKELPVYFVSGEDDPVGNYGKGVLKVCETYRKHGMKDIEMKLYPEDRHELINETDYEVVYRDILTWIEKKVHNM